MSTVIKYRIFSRKTSNVFKNLIDNLNKEYFIYLSIIRPLQV